MAETHTVTVLDHCVTAPPPGSESEMTLPLTFIDMMMMKDNPVKSLYFYSYPVSKNHFTETVVPDLKHSLSLTLKHFLPLVGNLIVPSIQSGKKPEIHYVQGDSVPLIFAVSSFKDFNLLTDNQPKECSLFYPLAPDRAPQSSIASGATAAPLLALQVTLFPGSGICIGVNAHHVAADASSINLFLKAWAYLSRLGGNTETLPSEYAPFCDRSVMKDTSDLDDVFWSQLTEFRKEIAAGEAGEILDQAAINPDLVQSTFILGPGDVKRLKNYVLSRQNSASHLSSFTVVCAYVWTSLLKSNHGACLEGDELDLLAFSADARGRCPAVPANYFGNCISLCRATAKHRELTGEEGLEIAANLIGKAISERLHDEQGIFRGAETWLPDALKLNFERVVGISGSPRFDFYDLDFGWGKPKAYDITRISESGVVLVGGGLEPGAVEIKLCFSRMRMDDFAVIFSEGLMEKSKTEPKAR